MPRYPSALIDAQGAMLEPEGRAARAGLVRAAGRRPMVHDLWAMLDAGLERQRYEAEGVAGHEVYGRCEVRLGCGRGAAYARRRSTP